MSTKLIRCKLDGEIFSDIENRGGALTVHLQKNYPDIVIPTLYQKRVILKNTGRPWFMDYFELIETEDEPKEDGRTMRFKKELDEDKVCEDYVCNGLSLHDLSAKYHTGRKFIKEILDNRGIELRKVGRQYKLSSYAMKPVEKYKNTEDVKYHAVSKKTGEIFTDFNDRSGELSEHVKNVYQEPIPTESEKSKYYQQTGNYWYEDYFDIVATKVKGKVTASEAKQKEVCRLYTQEHLGLHTIAGMTNIGYREIRRILEKHGITLRQSGGMSKNETFNY